MGTVTIHNIGSAIKGKRGDRGIRETAKEIGVSTATLSRIENGKLPDLRTFSKICKWMNVDASTILGCSMQTKKPEVAGPAHFHLKADKNLKPETAKALATMILAVQNTLFE